MTIAVKQFLGFTAALLLAGSAFAANPTSNACIALLGDTQIKHWDVTDCATAPTYPVNTDAIGGSRLSSQSLK